MPHEDKIDLSPKTAWKIVLDTNQSKKIFFVSIFKLNSSKPFISVPAEIYLFYEYDVHAQLKRKINDRNVKNTPGINEKKIAVGIFIRCIQKVWISYPNRMGTLPVWVIVSKLYE